MFQPNSVIAGRYQVIRLVGQGGMSNLYLAYDRKYSNATVVVKEMTASYSDPKEQQMAVDLFHREAKLLASLKHRHIPRVFDYFQFAGKYYLSMEFIDGEDLAVRLESKPGPLEETQVLEWGEQIATVLFYLHKHDPPIVFRDVKPSNIMITEKGIKLIDFGIARHFDQAKKGDTMRIGSPGYAPPEQYAAQTDPRSDIYALGVTLHHALTGRDPTATNTPFLVPPAKALNPKLSEATAAMLARATQIDPADRYQNVLELKKDIKHILSRGKQSTRVVGAPPALPQEKPKPAQASPAPATSPASSSTSAPVKPAAAPNPKSHASGSLTAAAAPNPAGSAVASPSPPSTPAPAKKRGRSFSTYLLASIVLLAGLGLTALGLNEDWRTLAQEKASQAWSILSHSLQREQAPEASLSEAILTGDTQALLSLLESEELQALMPEKQELYRLNLMAKAISPERIKILHVLYAERIVGSEREREVWSMSAQACKAVNSAGGLDKHLLVILPLSVHDGQAASVVDSLAERFPSHLSLLILGRVGESLAVPQGVDCVYLRDGDDSADHTVNDLNGSQAKLGALFESQLKASSKELHWSAGGQAPSSSTKDSPPPKNEAETKLLVEEARNNKLTLVLQAASAPGIENIAQDGSIILLASTPDQLPTLKPQIQAEALVSWSPFRPHRNKQAQFFPVLSPSASLAQARLYDTLVMAALPSATTYSGVNLLKDKSGKTGLSSPTRYRWTGSNWSPVLTNLSKDQS